MKQKINQIRKPVRTISGVTPLAVVIKPRKCNHGTCIYCPGGDVVPQSYTTKSPAIMRALNLAFDPYRQVKTRLDMLKTMGHPTGKIELIILGGTFMQYNLDYQYGFVKKCFDALNGKNSKNLAEAKKLNETAEHRCVAMCIENRPDNCSDKEIKRMLEMGTTRVEIGVQMPSDKIYQKIHRGHCVQDVIDATKRLKEAGFKLGYHIMPGLPGSNPRKDLKMFKEIFEKEEFRPDQLKLYPCQVVKTAPLAKLAKQMHYKPYTEKQTSEVLSKMYLEIPPYCRIMRVIREFPKETLVDGLTRLDLRKDIEIGLRNKKFKINEIRMREVGFNPKNLNQELKLNVLKYKASGGDEFFLEIVNKENILFGLLRLRLNKVAMIRELHVYGQALELGAKGKISQHKGLGKWLMEEAEKIAKQNKYKKIYVISGIGVREYYRKLGYKLEEPYMAKKL
ncbi:MAG: tRNA uridine(34) 5-carboxymethylaminomethyl modification radical SAM/GNAT enzyme Elp3 [Candidatus Pacearchaeota archaeon]|nr:tRNA uridine(34) 5-carboxymethylaminomethyl modification radical SAM/GNAT enzyme Elp3 [Candidatus Pacearchaeota archaeon]